jgi:pretoxin HINT domain-containing protein
MPDVTITLKTIDASSQQVKKVKDQYTSLTPALDKAAKGVAGFVSANATLIGVIAGVGAALGKSYTEFQKYAGSVRDLAIASGTGAKEASVLLQVLDDFEIGASDVTAAMKAMKEKGLVPTIDTLAKLSDEFLAIEDPAERLKFAQDNLGRSSAAFLNVLNQGSQALRENATQVNKNLILTDEQIEKSEKARLAVDAWADAWQGFTVALGAGIGSMIAANASIAEAQQAYEELNDIQQTGRGSSTLYTESVERLQRSMEKGAAATEFYTRMQQDMAGAIESDAIPTIEEMTEKNNGLLGVIEQLQSETDGYTEKNDALLSKLEELQAAQDMVPEWSSKYKEYGEQIEETKGAIDSLAEEHEDAGKRIAFALIQQKAAMDGLTDAEFHSLLSLGEQWGIYDKKIVESAIIMDEMASGMAKSLDAPREQLFDINAKLIAMKNMAKEGITMTISVIYQVTGGAFGGSGTSTVTGGNCFTGDTEVMLADGSSKPIVDIQVGDAVTSYNLLLDAIVSTRVVEVFKHERESTKPLLLINGYLKVTPEHLLWDGFMWRDAGGFEVGDELLNVDGGAMKITSIELLQSDETVYNLHVDNVLHNYFAGGVLVHNAKAEAEGFAGGGRLSGNLALVGDMPGGKLTPWSELITPDGTVIDAKTTRMLFDRGIVGNDVKSFAVPDTEGGPGGSGGTGPITLPQVPKPKPKPGRSGSPSSPSDGGSPSNPSDTNNAPGGDTIPGGDMGNVPSTSTAAVATAVVSLQQQLQQQQQATIKSNAEVVAAVEALAAIMTGENPRAIGKQVGYELSKAS